MTRHIYGAASEVLLALRFGACLSAILAARPLAVARQRFHIDRAPGMAHWVLPQSLCASNDARRAMRFIRFLGRAAV